MAHFCSELGYVRVTDFPRAVCFIILAMKVTHSTLGLTITPRPNEMYIMYLLSDFA